MRYAYQKVFNQTKQQYIDNFGQNKGARKHEKRFGSSDLLPIFNFQPELTFAKQITLIPESELTEEKILGYWEAVMRDYLELRAKNANLVQLNELENSSIETIQILALYQRMYIKNFHCFNTKQHGSLISSYPDALQARIIQSLTQIKTDLIRSRKKLAQKRIDIFIGILQKENVSYAESRALVDYLEHNHVALADILINGLECNDTHQKTKAIFVFFSKFYNSQMEYVKKKECKTNFQSSFRYFYRGSPTEVYQSSLCRFVADGLAIVLDNQQKNKDTKLMELAHNVFCQRCIVPRLIADLLMLISTLAAIGAIVIAYRAIFCSSVFFLNAKTRRESEFEKAYKNNSGLFVATQAT